MANETIEISENQKYHVAEVRRRVKLGNEKLYTAWKTITDERRNLSDEVFEAEMTKWVEATRKLTNLALELRESDQNDCLYIENGVKIRRCLDEPDGSWCVVCPCPHDKYHAAELMGSPPANSKGPPKAGACLF